MGLINFFPLNLISFFALLPSIIYFSSKLSILLMPPSLSKNDSYQDIIFIVRTQSFFLLILDIYMHVYIYFYIYLCLYYVHPLDLNIIEFERL